MPGTTRTKGRRRAYRGKRLLDLAVLAAAAPVWLPLLALVALLVLARLGRPVLFRQRRPGLAAQPFELFKFRTMTNDVDANGVPLPDVRRLTPFGRWLRSTSLDELPELLNVLRGDMSLVGPRPLLMQYVPLYSAEHRRRHDVPPGLTGLAQISGRNALTWPHRFELDLRYVETNSLRLDLEILLRTIRIVLGRQGIAGEGEATMSPFTGYEPAPPSPRGVPAARDPAAPE
jgi:sugar transferase EpsL